MRKDPESPFLYKGPASSDLKIQETLFFVIKNQLLFFISLKPTVFKLKFMFSFKANLENKKHQSNSLNEYQVWNENPSQWTILEPLCYASYTTLVYGEIDL